jgi:hypothetical protein
MADRGLNVAPVLGVNTVRQDTTRRDGGDIGPHSINTEITGMPLVANILSQNKKAKYNTK